MKFVKSISTIGLDQFTTYMKFMDHPIKLKIWDTAGQERFATLTENYFKPLDAVLLVFAFDNLDSLEQTCKWKEQI